MMVFPCPVSTNQNEWYGFLVHFGLPFDMWHTFCVTVGPLPTHSLWSHAWSDYEEDKCVPAGKLSYHIYTPILAE